MCIMTGVAAKWAGIDPMDPFGANKKNERQQEREDRTDTWAREDQIRGETFKHEQDLANKGTNRASLYTPKNEGGKKQGPRAVRVGDRAY